MQQTTTARRTTFVDLNVLPEELRPHRDPVWYLLGVVVILASGLLLIPLNRAKSDVDADTARLRSELELTQEELGRIQVDFGKARDLRQQVDATEAAILALDEQREAILGNGEQPSLDLLAAMLALPPGGHLSSITASEGLVSLQGRADQAADIIEYSRALVASGRFSEAQIASLAVEGDQEGGTGMTFVIQLARQAEQP